MSIPNTTDPYHPSLNYTDDADIIGTSEPILYYDKANNYTFSIWRSNDSTWVSPQLYPNDTNLVELRIGVLLPFHLKNNPKISERTLSGVSAIRLAVAEINTQRLIPGAYVTLIERDSSHKLLGGQASVTQAAVATVNLVKQGAIALIGDATSAWTGLSATISSMLQIPQCSFSAFANSLTDMPHMNYFFRTTTTNFLYVDAALSFVISQGWSSIGVIYSNDEYGTQVGRYSVMHAKLKGVRVSEFKSFYGSDDTVHEISRSIDDFVRSGVRVILIAATDKAQLALFTIAAHRGYMDSEHVWVALRHFNQSALMDSINHFNHIIEERQQQKDNASFTPSIADANDPIQYVATTTQQLSTIPYEQDFSGGVFYFTSGMDLTGYAPFDRFHDKWKKLDPKLYPYGGQPEVTRNEGRAYSCMMMMALGFNQFMHTFDDKTLALQNLSVGGLGELLTPAVFNVSFESPDGPIVLDENGNRITGNYRLFNLQNGESVQIGTVFSGNLSFTSKPMYYGGSYMVPSGLRAMTNLNQGFASPISIAAIVIASIGITFALASIMLNAVSKQRGESKPSRTLFGILESIGFTLIYTCVLFICGTRRLNDCYVIPITFHIGYSLILCNIIATYYHVYKISENIYLPTSHVTSKQLLKATGYDLFLIGTLVCIWLSLCDVKTVSLKTSSTSFYTHCSFPGMTNFAMIVLVTLHAACLLACAVFFAFKTRLLPKKNPAFKDLKMLSFSVWNIFFSTLIGFSVLTAPEADFYTRHYFIACTILWGCTVSLAFLFGPQWQAALNIQRALLSKRHMQCPNSPSQPPAPAERPQLGDIMSINYMMTNLSSAFDDAPPKNRVHYHHRIYSASENDRSCDAEAYEAFMPVSVIFRYLPQLDVWDMKHIVLFPRVGYFCFLSEKTHRGRTVNYTHASVASSSTDAYVIKVHGQGWFDVLIQVEQQADLHLWLARFNLKSNASYSRSGSKPSRFSSLLTSKGTSQSGQRFQLGLFSKDDQDVIDASDKPLNSMDEHAVSSTSITSTH